MMVIKQPTPIDPQPDASQNKPYAMCPIPNFYARVSRIIRCAVMKPKPRTTPTLPLNSHSSTSSTLFPFSTLLLSTAKH
jgi:hypothetical protein